jgi:hypothetical protein
MILLLALLTCADFNKQLEQTYGFRPSKLNMPAQEQKSKQMDAVWSAVRKDPVTLGPCLEDALAKAGDDNWFRFDGSQLLTQVDHSPETKAILLDAASRVDLDDVDLGTWVHIASSLGLDGLDTSALGKRWLAYPKADYWLPEHNYRVDRENGAMFIFGALDERFATPTLIELVRTSTGNQKEIATSMLMSEATPEALRAVAQMNADDLPRKVAANRKALLQNPALVVPRPSPRNTREEFLSAFSALLAHNERPFAHLVATVPDGERDLVAVATPADRDVIRKVRRYFIAKNTPEAIEYYNQFTQIIMTLIWSPDLVKPEAR